MNRLDSDDPRAQHAPANRKLASVIIISDGRVAVVGFIFIAVSYIGGAGVPSDHWATGTSKRVSGSGTRRGSSTTGEPSRFAPQVAGSVFGM